MKQQIDLTPWESKRIPRPSEKKKKKKIFFFFFFFFDRDQCQKQVKGKEECKEILL